ncbi:MAG: Biopolymer transport protein ExbB [Chlamydiales bacterium]|nr:Biopolymer transport protein ExbB [Chlamydiales bacterium]MCH9619450.1 Biopolymer transport protein ExbB [Chlamydiales bacterium]MCH9622254.1 Biopolymer transport protein ExbB [Chlamydiales bacterium]
MNPILSAYFGSDLFGKIIFLTLFTLSIVTWALFLQKYFLQKQVKREGFLFFQAFDKNRHDPLSLNPKDVHPFATLYRSLRMTAMALLKKNQTFKEEETVFLSRNDIDLMQAQLTSAASLQTKQLEKHLFILSTIVSLAPFLGLLGTVWGILLTFGELQTTTQIHANSTIMGGLSMALGTTVFGLLVAIPALIAHNYLRSSIRHFATDMDDFSQTVVASIELQYRKVDV